MNDREMTRWLATLRRMRREVTRRRPRGRLARWRLALQLAAARKKARLLLGGP